jgi:hypothetical protein
MKKYVALLAGLLFLASCVSNQKIDKELYKTYMTRTYNSSKNKCYNALLAALKELKIKVEKTDKEKGQVITDRVEFYTLVEVTGTQYSASGQSYTATNKYYFQVDGDNKKGTVRVTRYRLWRNAVEQTELNAEWCKENVWDPLFNEIQEKLNEE